MNLDNLKKVYVIGIKGSGVVSVVQILASRGIEISGSDTQEKFFTDSILKKLGVKYFEKFRAENIPNDVDLVIYSTAYNEENNEEFQEARRRDLEMISYPEILAELFNKKWGIAVCGTHGKTTTSAMLAEVLKNCGTDPSAVIGSKVINWDSSALSGKGEYFVIEADEFQKKLKLYEPKAAILTSIDWDHPDTFPTPADYKKAFAEFVEKIPKAGFLVVWGDSADTLETAKNARCEIIRYGYGEENEIRINNYEMRIADQKLSGEGEQKFQTFGIFYKEKGLGVFQTSLVGKHNVLNAASVIGVCAKLNLDMEKVREGIANFKGSVRRFEYIGKRNGAILIDDYGHHPEEIKATLKGARENYPDKNIIAVFHPHSYSRTEALLEEFAQSFDNADKIVVLDIYGSARENWGNVNSSDLVKLINKYNFSKAEYIPTISEAVEYLKDSIGENDLVLTIGAGNVFEVAEKLKEK